MVVKIDDSVNVIESIIFTRGQSYRDVYRFRFMVQLVKVAQEFIHQNFTHLVNGEEVAGGDFRYAELVFPLKSVLFSDKDTNYEQAKRSLLRFSDWVLVEDSKQSFSVTPVLSFAQMNRHDATLRVEVRSNVWKSLLDFSKGYSEYNPEVILKISSPLGRQMYKGLKNQKGIVSYSIENFKKVFGYEGKFVGRDTDFIKRVVEKAKKELDEKADYSFSYELVFGPPSGTSAGRPKLTGIEIVSRRCVGNESDDAVRKMVHPAQLVGSQAYRYLTEKLYFTFDEVKANVKLFEDASKCLGEGAFLDWLRNVTPKAVRANASVQGYVVASLKKYMLNKFGVSYGGKKPDIRIAEVLDTSDDGPGQELSESRKGIVDLLCADGRTGKGRSDEVHSIGELFSGTLFG